MGRVTAPIASATSLAQLEAIMGAVRFILTGEDIIALKKAKRLKKREGARAAHGLPHLRTH
jgi:aryl-alcohol dehydrogenase-like predicted oxidoreductase